MTTLKFFQHTILSFLLTSFICFLAVWQFLHMVQDKPESMKISDIRPTSETLVNPQKGLGHKSGIAGLGG